VVCEPPRTRGATREKPRRLLKYVWRGADLQGPSPLPPLPRQARLTVVGVCFCAGKATGLSSVSALAYEEEDACHGLSSVSSLAYEEEDACHGSSSDFRLRDQALVPALDRHSLSHPRDLLPQTVETIRA
jgi:hypothetical protein